MQLYTPNPHYVEFRGRPTLLVGSGEHYGAVLNTDFDYVPYLDTLQRHGLNQVRLFSGTYREVPGAFGIVENNLAPRAEAFLAPWVKTADSCFDLSTFNQDYFARLHDFIQKASERSIVVELVLFCFWYNDLLWQSSPMHSKNNIQGVGPLEKEKVYTLEGNSLLPYQEALVHRLVTELSGYDNLYFELINEPYSRHDHSMDLAWQHLMVDLIAVAEGDSRNRRHLVAINYNNRTQRIRDFHPGVSICNFHYAQPDAVKENYHLDRVIAYDETGFMGQTAEPYRREAWNFMLAGGGAFSHLDYSFTVAHPDGSGLMQGNTPGYGGEDLRRQLGFMRRFLESVEIWKMRPYNEMFAWSAGRVPAQVMCDPHRLYLAYFPESTGGVTHMLALPAGCYQLAWINPVYGQTFLSNSMDHSGGYLRVDVPGHAGDLILKLQKTS